MIAINMKNRIMFGVCLMCLTRKIKKPYVAESSVFVILAVILSILVSVPSVLSNMIGSGNLAHYFVIAFSSTELMVQTIIALAGLTMLFLLRNITIHTFLKQRFT